MILLTRLKLILRNWRRNKLFSITAIISLIIGFACCNLLTAFVINEWKISEGSPDKNRIFVLKTDNPMTLETTKEKSSFILKQIPPLFKEKYPEINTFCRFQSDDESSVFEADDFKSNKLIFLHADKNINEFFNIPVIAGNLQTTLSNPGEAAITSNWAKKVFGSINVLGKSFFYHGENGTSLQKITTIIDDSFASSFITFDILLPLDEKTYFGGVTFLKLKKSQDSVSLLQKLDSDIDELPRFDNNCKYYLQSLTDFYFDKSETQSNWNFILKRDSLFMYIGIITALAILFVACFNFINLYLVRLFKADTNNSIQKILGASSQQLQKQILLESFLVTIIGFGISIILVIIILPFFNNLFNAHLSISFLQDKTVLLFYLILITILTFIPAIYLGIKFDKKGFGKSLVEKTSERKTIFSNTMISIQFGFSVLLIIAAFIYTKQLNFISKTANINPNLIEIKGTDVTGDDLQFYKNEVNKLSYVEASTISSTGFLNSWIELGDDNVSILIYKMDYDFLKVHNIILKEGNGFTENIQADTKQTIVNETLINKYKIKEPLGRTISLLGKDITIIGVVKDFYTEPFSVKVKPTMIQPFYVKTGSYAQTLEIKLKKGTRQTALANLNKLWAASFPDKTFTYSFLADDFQALHKDYKQLAEMIGIFTIISILLTAFGLFAIAWYAVERRTKEIGIRKVNGAKISEIIAMLNKDFIKWVAIAFLVSCPVAYYVMSSWLENFAYKATISWWIFAFAGFLTLGIALLTVSWQSWRAATQNPIEALRYE